MQVKMHCHADGRGAIYMHCIFTYIPTSEAIVAFSHYNCMFCMLVAACDLNKLGVIHVILTQK